MTLAEKSENFVLDFLKKNLPTTFIYHNFIHTQRVVKSAKELIEHHTELSEEEKQVILVAAWFHDTGYAFSIEKHEDHSKEIAKNFLEKESQPQEFIEAVLTCIDATKFSKPPNNLLEKIIKDADCSHLAKDYYEETSEFLKQELKLHNLSNFNQKQWLDQNIKMFAEKHDYYTDYALKNWKPLKDQNLLKLLNKKNKFQKQIKKEKLKAQLKNESPERGIQTLYRTALRNHIKLSDIADTKANILLSVNAIIISVIISGLGSKLDNPSNSYLILPVVVLLLFSVASIIGAIMSTRPNVTSGQFSREDVEKREVNVLFFGNFHKMPYTDFEWAINQIISDRNYVYDSLTKDLFLLGKVLNTKYKTLRTTYTVFLIGIISSVTAFLVSFYLS